MPRGRTGKPPAPTVTKERIASASCGGRDSARLLAPPVSHWSGAYRVETTDPANGHEFLHFLKCGNSGLLYAPPTSLLRNGAGDNDFVGVVDRSLGFVFGEDTDSKTTGDIDWCPADGTYTVTWNDLLGTQEPDVLVPDRRRHYVNQRRDRRVRHRAGRCRRRGSTNDCRQRSEQLHDHGELSPPASRAI